MTSGEERESSLRIDGNIKYNKVYAAGKGGI